MKKALLIVAGVIVLAVIIIYGLNEYRWQSLYRSENVEPFNKNMQFVGTDRGYYYFGEAFPNTDGTVYLASSLTDRNHFKFYISIMKLDKDLKLVWEKKNRIGSFNLKDLLPGILRKDMTTLDFDIKNVTVLNGKIYALVMDKNKVNDVPYIAEFDLQGKLIKKHKIKLELEKNAYPSTRIHNGFAYICYLNHPDKMLCLTRIDITNGNIINTAVKFWNKLKPEYNSFTIDDKDSTACIALHDYDKNSSSYFVSKGNDMIEYFRTKSGTKIDDLEYLDGKFYGVVQEDSLLEIVDFTNPDKPLIIVTDKPAFKHYLVCGLVKLEDSFYLALDVPVNFGKKDQQGDVLVIKYSPDKLPDQFVIGGKKFDLASQIFITADKQIAVMGSSFSHKPTVGVRTFVSNFKL